MNKSKLKILCLLLIANISLVSCESSLTSNTSNVDANGVDKKEVPVDVSVETSGKISEGAYQGLEVVQIDSANLQLVISVPLPLPFGKEKKGLFDSKELDGSSWELKQYASNRWIAEIRVPLSKLVKGKFDNYSPSKLPNGKDHPSLLGGEMPGFALKWENSDKELFIYIGAGMAAVFIPSYEFDPYIDGSVDITTTTGEKVGVFAVYGQNDIFYGGFYLGAKLSPKAAIWVDNNLQ